MGSGEKRSDRVRETGEGELGERRRKKRVMVRERWRGIREWGREKDEGRGGWEKGDGRRRGKDKRRWGAF